MEYLKYKEFKESDIVWLNQVPKHWDVVRFSYFVSYQEGPGIMAVDFLDEGTPLIRIRNVQSGYVDLEGCNYLDPEKVEKTWKHFKCKKNDLIISGSASTGLVCEVNDNAVGSIVYTGLIRLWPGSEDINRDFIRWLVASELFFIQIKLLQTGSTIQHFGPEHLNKMFITLPALEEQQKIAAFLDYKTQQIDQLIEKKKALIEKLNEQRIAVITQAVTKGLDKNTKMKASGVDWLGDVPEHWVVGGFLKFVEKRTDYRGKTPEKVPDGVFLVTAKNIRNGRIDYEASKEYVREEQYEAIMSRGKPKIGDLLFTTEAPLGEVANVDREDIALAQRIIKFHCEPDKLDNYFAKYWMLSSLFQDHLQSLATGSTATGIKASKLFELRCVVPPLNEQHEIVNALNDTSIAFDGKMEKIKSAVELLRIGEKTTSRAYPLAGCRV